MVSCINNEEENGGYWLPIIQRAFVWNEDKIERLSKTVIRECPIRTFLFG